MGEIINNKNAKTFMRFVSLIMEKNLLQKKAVESFLKDRDNTFWWRAEWVSSRLLSLCEKSDISIEYIADAYLTMCKNMIKEQVRFRRTGKYTCQSASAARTNIYTSEKKMASYMYGLALSQFLWPNHYAMYDFFISESRKITGVESYLEIGPGHGLFLVESINNFPDARFDSIDISPVSNNISESIVKHFTGTAKCNFQVKDVNHLSSGKYDYIVMCEVLEHLDDPKSVMVIIRNLLNESGYFFITTCANCPAIDHVFQYHCVDHIRAEIQEAGFEIISELSLPVGSFTEDKWAEQKIEVNYAAMLRSL